nr:hypothetical protein Itr_chr02CG23660 [Ipomoea trifida]
MANRHNCILVVGILFLALTAHIHHAAQAAAGGGDGKNLVRWRKAMETPRHPSPVAPRKLRRRKAMGTSSEQKGQGSKKKQGITD